jgi:hypothetical protein
MPIHWLPRVSPGLGVREEQRLAEPGVTCPEWDQLGEHDRENGDHGRPAQFVRFGPPSDRATHQIHIVPAKTQHAAEPPAGSSGHNDERVKKWVPLVPGMQMSVTTTAGGWPSLARHSSARPSGTDTHS